MNRGFKILWKAGLRRHKGSVLGVFLLVFLVSLSLCGALAVSLNSGRYVRQEMERLGYGDITVWVSGLTDPESLVKEISSADGVSSVGVQDIIYSEYESDGGKSDSEGQLIAWEPEKYAYKVFKDDLSGYRDDPVVISAGEILVSASMQSILGLSVGDTVTFPIARSGVDKSFTVAGYFEDPFMGSSMIGMKSFLICREDYESISDMAENAGTDGLARVGYMLHITQSGELAASELNRRLNEETQLTAFTEFAHSAEVMRGFMLTLQNVFSGLMMAFVAVLLLVSLAMLSHSMGAGIREDTENMGILRTMGMTAGKLCLLQYLQYLTGIFPGLLLGMAASIPAAAYLCRMTVTTSGLLIPSRLPAGICIPALLLILLFLTAVIGIRCREIGTISPVYAIHGKRDVIHRKGMLPVLSKPLGFWLALRQLETGRKRYISVFLIALLLTFFSSVTGRINDWLGPDGKGLMDAFNPADLHIAAQPLGTTTSEEVESMITSYSDITDQYALAMPGVSVNGVDYTVNVITDPDRFHILSGNTCVHSDQIVMTEFAASDLGVSVGDSVTVSGTLGSGSYVVSGIYQCANDMGANIGMSREGYQRIGEDTPEIWCRHYFIEDPGMQPVILQALEDSFGGDVYVHENAWPGLDGILSAMKLLIIFQYLMTGIFILTVTLLASEKLLLAERRDLNIYRVMGVPCGLLRLSFALRFFLVSLGGSAAGILCSAVLTDPMAAVLMRMYGISNFSSRPDMGSVLLPGAVTVLLFTFFAYFASGTIKRAQLTELLAE